MAKLLRVRDYLMFGLAIAGEVGVEMRDPFELQARGCQEIYGWVPEKFRRGTRLVAVYRLLKTGDIEKIIKRGEPHFRLTNQGRDQLVRDFPILKLRKMKWDNFWTMVVFDIPEKQRKTRLQLVEKLLRLGFGMMQRSVYISPYDLGEDLREFLVHHQLANQVFVARVKKLFAGNQRELVIKIWRLNKINKEYKKILGKWFDGRGLEKTKDWLREELKVRYLEVLSTDPCLPRELLPGDWAGEKLRRIIV